MLVSKRFFFFLLFCVQASLSKPTESGITEGRGFGSTLWGWITYPFTWWSSGEEPPVTEQLIGSSTYGPYDDIEFAKLNVTVWCNDQTCTTMKCDKSGCTNVTCNIYDTTHTGECREYNTLPQPEEPKPTVPISKPIEEDKVTEVPSKLPEITLTTPESHVEDHPLELEAVLSSTVTEVNTDKVDASSSPQNKI